MARKRFLDRVEKLESGCWRWTGRIDPATGYGRLGAKLAHRISYELTHGQIADGLCACHTCDNRQCVNPEHLWLGTREENNRDRDIKGRAYRPKGEMHPRAKLTWQSVAEIRALAGKVNSLELALQYGVATRTIRSVIDGKNWRA